MRVAPAREVAGAGDEHGRVEQTGPAPDQDAADRGAAGMADVDGPSRTIMLLERVDGARDRGDVRRRIVVLATERGAYADAAGGIGIAGADQRHSDNGGALQCFGEVCV